MEKWRSLKELTTEELIIIEFEKLKKQLLQKNIEYNDSLHQPNKLFPELDALTGIKGRMTDKLNRLVYAGLNELTEDTMDDLVGYWIQYKIAKLRKQYKEEENKKQLQINFKNETTD